MYDVIIVGARCAGAPTAMLLARKGYRVLLVDRSTFPSDTLSTHYIHQAGVAQLMRWGLLNKIRASNCPPIIKATLDFGDFALSGSPTPAGNVDAAYAPRRKVLDNFLVNAAVGAGADLREGFFVQELVLDGGYVTGIRGRTKSKSLVTEKARIIVGADGKRSFIARAVHASEYCSSPSFCCAYYAYWSGVPCESFENYMRDGATIGAFPTNDGLTCVVAAWTNDKFPKYRANIERTYMNALSLAAGLAERLQNGKREERIIGTADLPGFFRKPYGPGWALVGDAGYHKHPLTAQGITDSFRDAELLAQAINDGFFSRQSLDQALLKYEQLRNKVAMPIYKSTCHRAALKLPSPQMLQLLIALQGNQLETNRFFGIDAGTVSYKEFFQRKNIQRIIGATNHSDKQNYR